MVLMPAELSQARFAELLGAAMDELGITGEELASRTGYHAQSISRYRQADYEQGPPVAKRRRRIEEALGAPSGYLDDQVSWQPTISGGIIREASLRPYTQGDVGVGWLWGDPEDQEEQARALIDGVERTVRTSNSGLGAAQVAQLKLAVVNALVEQVKSSGRKVPDWLYRMGYELSQQTR